MRLMPALRSAAVVATAAAVATTVLAGSASAADVANRTVFATHDATGRLDRMTLDRSGTVVARTPVHLGAGAKALDYARGRMVFTKPGGNFGQDSTLWLREADGRSRQITNGKNAVFTPGGTAILFVRTVIIDNETGFGDEPHDELWLYYLSDGRMQQLSRFSPGAPVRSRMRYSAGGGLVYFITGDEGMHLSAYSPAQRKIVRKYHPDERSNWEYGDVVELLPSGTRALLSNYDDLVTLNLSTGQESNRVRRERLDQARGRLSSSVYLVSGVGRLDNYLGSLDVSTMTIRALTGSSGYRDGVTAYQLP